MYKILIADDEQIVLDSMEFIIKRNIPEAVLAGTARSGREVIEKAELIRPDIIIMDIKMPGINGIEAIREIKSRFSDISFIIMTAYEQFEFAKEAINLDVQEYLLKPVNKNKLIDTIKNTIRQLDANKEKRSIELKLKERLGNITTVLENGFISAMIFFDDYSKELNNYRDIFEINEEYGYMVTIEFGDTVNSGYIGNKIGLSIKIQSFYSKFRDLMKSKFKCFIGPNLLNRIIIFVPTNFKGDEYKNRIEAISFGNYIIDILSENIEDNFFVGIGRIYNGMGNMILSYEESVRAIRYCSEKCVIHIMDVPLERNVDTNYPVLKEKLLLEKASTGDTDICLKSFYDIFDWLSNEYENSVSDIKKKLIEVVVLLHRYIWDYKIDGAESGIKFSYLEEFLAIDDISELRLWCIERIKLITCAIKNNNNKELSGIVIKAKNYIDANYNREITLNEISKEVNITPSYFSKLFRNETKENFIDYLTFVRIQKAKEFLQEDKLSIKEICYKIGYGDPNYLSRIFKKIIGLTPTEYKDALLKG